MIPPRDRFLLILLLPPACVCLCMLSPPHASSRLYDLRNRFSSKSSKKQKNKCDFANGQQDERPSMSNESS
uniref:Putative secreted protein n=1 Tax=Anopheles darlingi TaxID=43151 RepID=A0A2M4DFM5_ANODA